MEFHSLKELNERVKPALYAKAKEMERSGYPYVLESDIWNYLKEVKWKYSKDLELSDIVRDILNTENSDIEGYLKQKVGASSRVVYFDGTLGGQYETK